MKTTIIDCETTGIPSKNADYKINYMEYPYLVSIAYKINDKPTKEFIINQEGLLIPEESIKIHGITNEMAQASRYNILDIIGEIIIDIQGSDYIIGHHIFFDSSTIKANILRLIKNGRTSVEIYDIVEDILHKDKRIDTMRLCHKLFGGKWPTLSEAYFKLFGRQLINSHNAKNDVEACNEIYLELVKRGLIVHKWDNACVVEEE